MRTITTKDDADADDETFTVALGELPVRLAPGSPSSVTVRIEDVHRNASCRRPTRTTRSTIHWSPSLHLFTWFVVSTMTCFETASTRSVPPMVEPIHSA